MIIINNNSNIFLSIYKLSVSNLKSASFYFGGLPPPVLKLWKTEDLIQYYSWSIWNGDGALTAVNEWSELIYPAHFLFRSHLCTVYVHPWLLRMQTYQAYLFFPSIGLNPLPFDPATNNEPLQFSSSNGPLLSECPLENGTENNKKRKRPNLPPGTLNDFLSPQTTLTHTRQALQSLTAFTSLFLPLLFSWPLNVGGERLGVLHSERRSLQIISFIKTSEHKPQVISTSSSLDLIIWHKHWS